MKRSEMMSKVMKQAHKVKASFASFGAALKAAWVWFKSGMKEADKMKTIQIYRKSEVEYVKNFVGDDSVKFMDMGGRGIGIGSSDKDCINSVFKKITERYCIDYAKIDFDKKADLFFFVIAKIGVEKFELPQSYNVVFSMDYNDTTTHNLKKWGALFDRENKLWYMEKNQAVDICNSGFLTNDDKDVIRSAI